MFGLRESQLARCRAGVAQRFRTTSGAMLSWHVFRRGVEPSYSRLGGGVLDQAYVDERVRWLNVMMQHAGACTAVIALGRWQAWVEPSNPFAWATGSWGVACVVALAVGTSWGHQRSGDVIIRAPIMSDVVISDNNAWGRRRPGLP